jgi:hypothetical protein
MIVEISKSLSVLKHLQYEWRAIQSTGFLDGQLPRIPKGVFDFTAKHKEDVLTWQPRRCKNGNGSWKQLIPSMPICCSWSFIKRS